jgi:hypothetical protein
VIALSARCGCERVNAEGRRPNVECGDRHGIDCIQPRDALRFVSMNKLDGKKVAILVANFFEQVEMTKPRAALEEAGAEVKIVSPDEGKIQGMNHEKLGDKFDVDLTLDEARPEEFDALMIPGGTMNPDTLRSTPEAVELQSISSGRASRSRPFVTRPGC